MNFWSTNNANKNSESTAIPGSTEDATDRLEITSKYGRQALSSSAQFASGALAEMGEIDFEEQKRMRKKQLNL